jgi:hypothetical protein
MDVEPGSVEGRGGVREREGGRELEREREREREGTLVHEIIFNSLKIRQQTALCVRVGNTPDSYSGDPGFKSQPSTEQVLPCFP